jgi:hypothetical protein
MAIARRGRVAVDASAQAVALYVLAACVVGGYLWHCWLVDYVVDDSFITFRYVKHFVAGHGMVYNAGERVEGYTNFLWLLLLSAFAWADPDVDLLRVAQILGVLCGATTLVLVIRFSWRLHRRESASGLIAAGFLACNASFCAWSTSGLETTLFALLVFAAVSAYVTALECDRDPLAAAALFALAALTRPEGVLVFGVVTAHLLWAERRTRHGMAGRRTITWCVFFTLIYAPYYLWRLSYYGYPFPNTFYAKVGADVRHYLYGARYLIEYVRWNGAFIVPLALIALLARRNAEALNVMFLTVGAYLAYIVYVGGDGLAFFRFVACVAPLAYVLVQEGFIRAYEWSLQRVRPARRWTVAVAAAVVLASSLIAAGHQTLGVVLFPGTHRWYEPQSELSFPGTGRDHDYVWFDNYFADRLATAARWLEVHAPPDAVVAATPAGAIGYYMDRPVIDMLGLNDVHIAHTASDGSGNGRIGHEKGDGKYVLSRAPEYILLGNVAVLPRPIEENEMASKLVQRSEHEIWVDPEFHRLYERHSVKLSDTGVFRYFTFYRRKASAAPSPSYPQ